MWAEAGNPTQDSRCLLPVPGNLHEKEESGWIISVSLNSSAGASLGAEWTWGVRGSKPGTASSRGGAEPSGPGQRGRDGGRQVG